MGINGAQHSTEKVPAHRVVNRNGMLSGKAHFGTPTKMQELLEKEKIKVVDDKWLILKYCFGILQKNYPYKKKELISANCTFNFSAKESSACGYGWRFFKIRNG